MDVICHLIKLSVILLLRCVRIDEITSNLMDTNYFFCQFYGYIENLRGNNFVWN
jgi:hypothetical protein